MQQDFLPGKKYRNIDFFSDISIFVLYFRWTYYDFYLRYRVLCHSKDVRKNDFRVTSENIISKLINDEDKYRFGKSKLFFRAGQVAYMEKLRSERLRDCGVMIQKHVKGFLYRKKYQKIRGATMTIQRWSRGFMARRQARFMRRTAAVIKMQKIVRGWVKRIQYQKLQSRTVRLQARMRGFLARIRHRELLRNSKALIIQKNVRMWLQKKRYRKELRQIIIVQGMVKRFLARKKLKALKIQAKSVEHQKKLNMGLENKIISLQQRLTESEKSSKALKNIQNDHNNALKELDSLKKVEKEGKSAQKRIQELEAELSEVKIELDKEKTEKVDIVNERQKENESFREKEVEFEKEITGLKTELSVITENANTKGLVDSEELRKRVEEEKANIHAEYDQDRIAYQKLLKDYNRLEAQLDNVQDELHQARGGSGDRSMSNMSSFIGLDDESAYGTISGKRSTVNLYSKIQFYISLGISFSRS